VGVEIGLPDLAKSVAAILERLPVGVRTGTVIPTGECGEPGPLQRYGPASGLPVVCPGQTTFRPWGAPPGRATTVVAVELGDDPRWPEGYIGTVERAATIDNAAGADDDEQCRSTWSCRGFTRPWSETWPGFQHCD
jgi:hypothetical protein